MSNFGKRTRSILCRIMACVGVGMLIACAGAPRDEQLASPRSLVAPYDTLQGEVLFAFAPLNNESGTTEVDVGMVTDRLVAAAEEVQGVRTVPLNRTLQAMRALNMTRVSSPEDAMRLTQAMGVDAIIVGSITNYDPYTPVLGMTLGLYARPGSLQPAGGRDEVDPRSLTSATTDRGPNGTRFSQTPGVVVSGNLDGKNHQVLQDVKTFARGRAREQSALRWERYIASMPLFCEFAAYRMMDELMQREWIRLGRVQARVEDK